MFDIALRSLKDSLFLPVAGAIPHSITPTHLTFIAFLLGSLSSLCCAFNISTTTSVALWLISRLLDCLDGAVARQRNVASDLGGFWDLLGDFVVYASIPISCAMSRAHATATDARADLLAVSLLEAAFFVNNFALFYMAAVAEKAAAEERSGSSSEGKRKTEQLTSLMMRPALVEGAESAAFFTLMLVFPEWVRLLSYIMFLGVVVGTGQRAVWFASVFEDQKEKTK